MKLIALVCAIAAVSAAWSQGLPGTALKAWAFDQDGQLQGWEPNGHLRDVAVRGGALLCTASDWDPFLTSPVFEIPARPWQYIEVKMKSDLEGGAQFFWTNTLQSEYAGFSPGKQTSSQVLGDSQWHVYRIFPFWHTEQKIIRLRFDQFERGHFEIASIRIMDGQPTEAPGDRLSWNFRQAKDTQGWWSLDHAEGLRAEGGALRFRATRGTAAVLAPPLRAEIGDRSWVTLRARVSAGEQGSICWATENSPGLHQTAFRLMADGKDHTYNVDLGNENGWSGKLLALGVQPSHAGEAEAEIEALTVGTEPVGAPDLAVTYFGPSDAINRTRRPCRVLLNVLNSGGQTASGVRAVLSVPKGLRLVGAAEQKVPDLQFMIPEEVTWQVIADQPLEGSVTARLVGPGQSAVQVEGKLRITPSLGLQKAEYVPEPKPVKTNYDLLMYYFPGWNAASKWDCVRRIAPIRKPVLGYYDEGNPECADWQIKWAAEHGIKAFLVDWYWSQSGRSLEHWLHDAYMKSRHRKYLQWAIMWANHNAPDTHSLEDWRNVTQYWIDHCFSMPEYYRIDDRPAVFIWAPTNVRRDLGSPEKTKELYDLSQQMAKAAGYKGIYFVAMGGHDNPQAAAQRVAEGFEGASTYHWWGDAQKQAKSSKYFPFEGVVATSKAAWAQHDAVLGGKLSWLFTMDSGWDSRPWHGDEAMVCYGRTPDLFERLLREGKAFADETNRKIIAIGPCNEWGEGSYLEPCAEYGFEMYDRIRKVFCEPTAPQAPGGWPPNIAPVDVGLGPYDFPTEPAKTQWTFDQAGKAEGWGAMMGLSEARVEGGRLTAKTTSNDPAFISPSLKARAREWPYIVLRMRVTPPVAQGEQCQMFWTTPTAPTSEATSTHAALVADGDWHTYVLPVGANPRWRGLITTLRFDPCSSQGRLIEIEEIRLSKEGR